MRQPHTCCENAIGEGEDALQHALLIAGESETGSSFGTSDPRQKRELRACRHVGFITSADFVFKTQLHIEAGRTVCNANWAIPSWRALLLASSHLCGFGAAALPVLGVQALDAAPGTPVAHFSAITLAP
jgi:hypothetical protein